MKRIQLATIFLVLIINISTCLEYSDDDDDDFPINFDDYIADEDDNEKPQVYDLKEAPKLFKKFVKDFHKEYKTDAEYNTHYKNFVNNLKDINEINKKGTSTADINAFADLSEKEFSVLGR